MQRRKINCIFGREKNTKEYTAWFIFYLYSFPFYRNQPKLYIWSIYEWLRSTKPLDFHVNIRFPTHPSKNNKQKTKKTNFLSCTSYVSIIYLYNPTYTHSLLFKFRLLDIGIKLIKLFLLNFKCVFLRKSTLCNCAFSRCVESQMFNFKHNVRLCYELWLLKLYLLFWPCTLCNVNTTC